ncbi:DUF1707 SHOCT-like domain-containing protein [Sphaerimonospora sp. CA-214678]|uniref:DUF1707 SHOCT-like domain-containing protein n=1 Tax=Sphaerimonospora sp. CA-214678 TaxID=3240029 RepID=UPI003D8BFC51
MTDEHDLPTTRARLRISTANRELALSILNEAAADGRLALEELEERHEAVLRARTRGELAGALKDLVEDGSPLFTGERRDSRIGGRPGSRFSLAIFSGSWRKGGWVLPHRHTSAAFWGRAELDLRDARFTEAESVITCFALMGGIEIVVPAHVTVQLEGVGLLGAFYGDDEDVSGVQDSPVVRVRGLAVWGAVHITRSAPGGGKRGQGDGD